MVKINLGNITFRLKEQQDFSWLEKYGKRSEERRVGKEC